MADSFELSEDEQTAVWGLVNEVQRRLRADPGVVEYSLGVNVGTAAGQTLPHVHIHVIPRRTGDRPDPPKKAVNQLVG